MYNERKKQDIMRKRLERISMLMGYLRDFAVEGLPAPILGVNNEQTTNALVSKTGPQLVAAYPELSHTGNSDCYTETLQSVFFVLDKSLGATRTEVSEFEQYMGLMELADAVLTKIERDTSADPCSPLGGLTLMTAKVAPEGSIFGGWCGYSIEVTMK